MSRSLLSLSIIFFSDMIFAHNQIHITATVPAHAETQMKMLRVDKNILTQSIYLRTNHQGLTIALSNNSYGSSSLINNRSLSTIPMNFSDKIYSESTKVGELIISQKENHGSLAVTISVK